MVEKKQFNYTVKVIKYYWLVRSLTPIKSIFFLLIRLSPLIDPPTDLNHIESKSFSRNSNLNDRVDINDKMDNEVLLIDRLPHINPNQTKNKSCSDYYNMCNIMGEEIPFINLNWTEIESCNDIYNVVGKEIAFIEEI